MVRVRRVALLGYPAVGTSFAFQLSPDVHTLVRDQCQISHRRKDIDRCFRSFFVKKILEDQITKSALQSSRVPQPSCNRIYGGLRSGLNGVPECAMFLFHYSCTYECSSICVTVLRITFSFSLSHWVSCVPCNSFEWSACAFRKDHDLQILGEHHYVGENILERPCETIYRFLHRSGSYFFDGEKQNSGYLFFIRWCDFPFLVLLLMLLFSRAACQC